MKIDFWTNVKKVLNFVSLELKFNGHQYYSNITLISCDIKLLMLPVRVKVKSCWWDDRPQSAKGPGLEPRSSHNFSPVTLTVRVYQIILEKCESLCVAGMLYTRISLHKSLGKHEPVYSIPIVCQLYCILDEAVRGNFLWLGKVLSKLIKHKHL